MHDHLTRTEQSDGLLRRELKSRHLQLIALGGIIGSGYFLGTAEVLSPSDRLRFWPTLSSVSSSSA